MPFVPDGGLTVAQRAAGEPGACQGFMRSGGSLSSSLCPATTRARRMHLIDTGRQVTGAARATCRELIRDWREELGEENFVVSRSS